MNLWSLKHPNIIEIFGVTRPDFGGLAIICPWQENGNATGCLKNWMSQGTQLTRPIVEYSNTWVSSPSELGPQRCSLLTCRGVDCTSGRCGILSA